LRFLTAQIGDESRTEPLSLDRSYDYEKIERLLNCPAVIFETFIYLIDGDNLWSFHPDDLSTTCMDKLRIHANLHTFKGKQSQKSMKESFDWIFNHTDTSKIYARVPKDNRSACFLARQTMNFIKADERHHYEVVRCLH